MFLFLLKCILPFILVTLLYIINIVFLSKKTTGNVRLWKTSILVLNIIALCLSILIVLPLIVLITLMSLGTGSTTSTTSITELEFNLESATLILLTITSFIYFFVTNIVLTILMAKKQFHQGIPH